MSNVNFESDLNPLKDGLKIQRGEMDMVSRHAVVMGTNGRYRLVGMKEARNILESLRDCAETMFLDDDYMIFYNADKVFRVDGGVFLAGSFLVTKLEGQKIAPLTDREIGRLFSLLSGRMEQFRAGDEVFDALEIR